MPDRLRPAIGLAMAALVLLLTGCGGSGTPTKTTTQSPAEASAAKARFIAQAKVICGTLGTQEKALRVRQEGLKGLSSQSAVTEFVSLVHQLVADSRTAEGKLRALLRPAADAHPIERLLSAMAEEAAAASGIAKAAGNQESALGEVAARTLKRTVANNSAPAVTYGMGACVGSE